jgi:hypothetical protein
MKSLSVNGKPKSTIHKSLQPNNKSRDGKGEFASKTLANDGQRPQQLPAVDEKSRTFPHGRRREEVLHIPWMV